MKSKKNKGITLVALVITIIILLILAGITISSLTNTGLFGRAKEAKEKTQEAGANQTKILDEYETALNQYDEKTIVYKVNNGTIKIGDYVSYTPDTASTEEILSKIGTYSGNKDNTKNTTKTLVQEKNLKWRVLDVQNGQVRLISETPTTSTIALAGYNGYNNDVKLLDDTCSTLYNSKLASKVQNLKIEDIQDKMKEKNYSNLYSEYGKTYSTSLKNYPSIVIQEKDQKVNEEEGTLGLSTQNDYINQTTVLEANSLVTKTTMWTKLNKSSNELENMTTSDFNEDIYYKLFINNGENYNPYLMSSRCVLANSNCACFGVYGVGSGKVGATFLYNSQGDENSRSVAFRPVITLNSNVQIDTSNSGDGSTAEQAYVIK